MESYPDMYTYVDLVRDARVPIIRSTYHRFNIQIDISLHNVLVFISLYNILIF
jgi:DNA polymerase sigma